MNPDTLVLDGAIQRLVRFADARPESGIYGGRTLYEDGSLNATSCWARPTPWSFLCRAVGLTALFPRSALFNPEAYGSWPRDSVRQVDIVTGCFLLIQHRLWKQLGGFDPIFFMYGEEADLCLRSIRAGARPVIDPESRIVHYGGRSVSSQPQKWVQMLHAKRRLAERHWPPALHPYARGMLRVLVVIRMAGSRLLAALGIPGASDRLSLFREVWRRRLEWIG